MLRVPVGRVEVVREARTVSSVGTVYAAEEAVISSQVAGVLTRTFADVGDEISAGEPLAEVEPDQYELAVREAEAALEATLASLGLSAPPDATLDIEQLPPVRRAAAELANAQFSYDRLAKLREELSLADQEYSTAVRDLRVAEANVAVARDEAAALLATARERQAALDLARRRLDDARIEAPPIPSTLRALVGAKGAGEGAKSAKGAKGAKGEAAEGVDIHRWVAAERFVTEGQYVQVATRLYRLIVSDVVLLRAEVAQRHSGQMAVGLSVSIEVAGGEGGPRGAEGAKSAKGAKGEVEEGVDGGPGGPPHTGGPGDPPSSDGPGGPSHTARRGRICRIHPTIDAASRTYRVDVLVDNRDAEAQAAGSLTPGAFARVTITTREFDEVVRLPAAAVRALAGVSTVFVVDAASRKVSAREVRVLRRQGGEIVVQGGLVDGETVVLNVPSALVEGMEIEATEEVSE